MSCAEHSKLNCEVCFPRGAEPQAHGSEWQQKGETMPKGEGPRKIQEVWVRTIANVLKMLRPGEDEDSIFLRQSAEAFIEELRQPTASGEWMLREALAKIVAEYDAYMKIRQVMPTHALIDAIAAGEEALQSVPSSPLGPNAKHFLGLGVVADALFGDKPPAAPSSPPPEWCNICKAPQYVTPDGEHHCGKPSDAGQPSLESTETIVKILDGDLPPMAANHCDAIAAALEAHDKRIVGAALEKLRERIAALPRYWPDWDGQGMDEFSEGEWLDRSEVLTLFAPAPRPAEKD